MHIQSSSLSSLVSRLSSLIMLCILSQSIMAQTDSVYTYADTVETYVPSWDEILVKRLEEVAVEVDTRHYFTGICVYDLTDDRFLFGYNQNKMMRPASTQKMVTAVAALDQLGAYHMYETNVYRTGTTITDSLGVISWNGDIYVTGDFDPLLEESDLQRIPDLMRNDYVSVMNGYVYADISMKDTLLLGNGWCWDDENPALSPVMLRGNSSTLTSSKIGRFRPENYFTGQIIKRMQKSGIDFISSNPSGVARYKGDGELIHTYSHSLNEVLQLMMKSSDNKHAESVFFQLGNSAKKGCSWKDCAECVKKTIRYAVATYPGVSMSEADIADGSGLSLYNYITPRMEVALLTYAYKNSNIFDYLYASMPVAGVDGTLKSRMKKGRAYNNVHAKTGTVTGVSCLAGYVTASNGHLLAFSIMNNGVHQASEGRSFQDTVCEILAK